MLLEYYEVVRECESYSTCSVFANGAVTAAFVHLFNHEAGRAHSHKKPQLKAGLYPVTTKGLSASLIAAGEGGDLYLFDDANKRTLHYGYLAGGVGLSGGGSVFAEKGDMYVENASSPEGWTVSLDGDFTFGTGVNSSASGNPFNGYAGASSTLGISAGYSFGASLLLVNTFYIETIPYSSVPRKEFDY